MHSRRSLRPPPSNKTDSTSSLVSIPADVIVALRTASFSKAHSKDIEQILQETEVVLRRKIPDGTKLVIRERYRTEGGDLSKFLLAWLKETLGDSEGSMSLSIDDLSSIFAGADKIAEQMLAENSAVVAGSPVTTANSEPGISGDDELSPLQNSISSGENPSSSSPSTVGSCI